uniref:Uncharacterized protein n=1 Tax=Anguilla anguilla TaxID=7936 RepID=A0A0E9SXB4_ANGAN
MLINQWYKNSEIPDNNCLAAHDCPLLHLQLYVLWKKF